MAMTIFREISERIENKLDNIPQTKIAFWGIFLLCFLSFLSYLCLVLPIGQQLEDAITQKDALVSAIKQMEDKELSGRKAVPAVSELPELVADFRTSLTDKSVQVEEILIEQLSSAENSNYQETALKATLSGDRSVILKAVRETDIHGYSFFIQELDINQDKVTLHYKILFSK